MSRAFYFASLRSLLAGSSRPVPAQDLNISAIAPVMLLPVAVALPRPAISQVANPWMQIQRAPTPPAALDQGEEVRVGRRSRGVRNRRLILAAKKVSPHQLVRQAGLGYRRFSPDAMVGPIATRTLPWTSTVGMASPMPASWNQIASWLQQIDGLRRSPEHETTGETVERKVRLQGHSLPSASLELPSLSTSSAC